MITTTEKFIEWVDALPPTWGAKRLGSLASVKARLGWKGLKAEEYVDAGYVFLSTPNLKGDEIDFENVNYITKARYDESPEIMLRVGDVLMVKDGATRGIVALVKNLPAPATLNGSTAVIRTNGECDSRFLCHWLRSKGVQQLIEKMKGGMGVPHLFQSDLRRFPVALPPPAEQRRIAAYLDAATGKIDRLMSLRRRQMELLREQRAALIQQAVTRGLDPRAPLKDSSLPWLGQIPAHWTLTRIKRESKLISKGTTPSTIGSDLVESGVRFLKAENICDGTVSSTPDFFVSDDTHFKLSRSQLKPHDLLVVIAGATTGKSGVLPAALTPANLNQAVSFIRFRSSKMSYFCNEWLAVSFIQEFIRQMAVQSAQPNLSMQDLGNIPIVTMPDEELGDLLKGIRRIKDRFERLLSAYARQIELLAEYRASLIHECVTGQHRV